jgi:hypothetical protein
VKYGVVVAPIRTASPDRTVGGAAGPLTAPGLFDRVEQATVVVEPERAGPGSWAGAPSAVRADREVFLAYRLRRPVGQGRGYANVVARSDDGVHFSTVAVLDRGTFGGDSLERPALVRTPEGRWRVYVSVATPGSKHWRVDLLEAAEPAGLAMAAPITVMPGGPDLAVKDPVVRLVQGRWHAWASRHPLGDPDATDRMTTDHATSDDGVGWAWHGTALAGRPGAWDARGVRVADVLLDEGIAFYDGRATAEQNWEEQTGLARIDELGRWTALGDRPLGVSPHGLGGLRYVSTVPLADGSTRFYVEVTRADGGHDLRTFVVEGAGA